MLPIEPARRPASSQDLLAIPEETRWHEVIDGELVRRAEPSFEHGEAQLGTGAVLRGPFHRDAGHGGPGGWWLVTEVEVELAVEQVYRPDLVGWRRDRMKERPADFPVKTRPDWVCEVISAHRASDDTVRKMRAYHAARIPHYWLVDPRDGTLAVYRHAADGFLLAMSARRGETVRAEPFDAIEIAVAELFGGDASG